MFLCGRVLERLSARGQAVLVADAGGVTALLNTIHQFTANIRDRDAESDSDEEDECEYDEDEDVVEIACHALYYLSRENPPSRSIALGENGVEVLDAAEGRFGKAGPYGKMIHLLTDKLLIFLDETDMEETVPKDKRTAFPWYSLLIDSAQNGVSRLFLLRLLMPNHLCAILLELTPLSDGKKKKSPAARPPPVAPRLGSQALPPSSIPPINHAIVFIFYLGVCRTSVGKS